MADGNTKSELFGLELAAERFIKGELNHREFSLDVIVFFSTLGEADESDQALFWEQFAAQMVKP